MKMKEKAEVERRNSMVERGKGGNYTSFGVHPTSSRLGLEKERSEESDMGSFAGKDETSTIVSDITMNTLEEQHRLQAQKSRIETMNAQMVQSKDVDFGVGVFEGLMGTRGRAQS